MRSPGSSRAPLEVAAEKNGRAPTRQTAYIAKVVTAYWVVSISMVYLNKFLLSSESASVPAPLFVTWFQCVVTCAICYCLGELGARGDSAQGWLSQFPEQRFEASKLRDVAPLSFIFVGMIAFNQLCLKFVEVSFYSEC